MIDLRELRDNPERLRTSQRLRGEDPELVDALLTADGRHRSALTRFESLRAEQKSVGRQVASATGDERTALLEKAQALATEVRSAQAEVDEASAEVRRVQFELSNYVEEGVQPGGEDDYRVLEHVGAPRDFAAEGFDPRDHVELGRLLGAIDVERGAKVSGARFYYLTGPGAQLELALTQLAMEQATAAGFVPVIPPSMVRPRVMEGSGFLGQAAENVYYLEKDELYLVGTSEVPLAGYHMDEILDAQDLPLRYAGFSPCYRREAGSYGKDTRGIFRVHWFDKVEMFSFCRPEDAAEEHRRLLNWEKEFLDKLELPYRVIEVAAGDLGASAARKYDCEAWIPSQGRYREVTSASNCLQFQSRRLGIRMRDADGTRHLATLNGTLCAMSRTILAIVENHQQADGSVRVPPALRPYFGGRDAITPSGVSA
ncbi:MAG TPA: serine--tRNA ligase [Actinomycetes bacterium]|nr:serine--tRNA ligase [Actinomycetes bacterium]